MQLPGHNELRMTKECVMRAMEDVLNAVRRDGEDYVHVVALDAHYGSGELTLTVTTDPQPVVAPASVSVLEAA